MRITPSARATIAAGGTGRVTLGPVPWGEQWRLTSVSVASTSTARTKATVYRSTALDTARIDVTRVGGNGATTDTIIDLHPGEAVVIVWEGGDVGAEVSATAEGHRTDPYTQGG